MANQTFLAEFNLHLAATQGWRKQALCASDVLLAPHFTADVVPETTRRQMKELCDRCPVRQQCAKAANTPQRATAGFWAGRSYNQWGGS